MDPAERKRKVVERILNEGRVKRHKFLPSGREIWSVVGTLGDQFVAEGQPFCTCGHFHFGVLGGKAASCIHLDAVRVAKRDRSFETLDIEDADYGRFLLLLTRSIHAQFGSK